MWGEGWELWKYDNLGSGKNGALLEKISETIIRVTKSHCAYYFNYAPVVLTMLTMKHSFHGEPLPHLGIPLFRGTF